MQRRLPLVYFWLREQNSNGFWQAFNWYAQKFSVENEIKKIKDEYFRIATVQISDNALKEMFGVSFYAFTPSESLQIPVPQVLKKYVDLIEVESDFYIR